MKSHAIHEVLVLFYLCRRQYSKHFMLTYPHRLKVKVKVKSCPTLCNPMLLLLNRFSRVHLCVTPQMAAYQAPPSLRFSRQECWSGLSLPSPLRPHRLQLTRLLCPWDFPGNSTGVDCHFLLQGIFPTQGLSLGLLHCREMLYCLSHQIISRQYYIILVSL